MYMTKLLIKLFIKNYSDTKSPSVRSQYGIFSGVTGIILNVILCIIKIFSGILSGSVSIIADAVNNAEVKYFEQDDKLVFNYVEFTSNIAYKDKIRVLHNGIILLEEDGDRYILLTYASGRWDELLAMKNPKITKDRY